MQLLLFKSLILAFVVAPGAHAHEEQTSPLRSNWRNRDDHPLSLDVVIKNVARHLWNGNHPRPFVIKGSYPASVWAYEHAGLNLPYNDIDVVVQTPVPTEKCQNDGGTFRGPSLFGSSNLVSSSYVQGLIPGSDKIVQVVSLCDIDNPEELITKFSDINSVNIGFTVVPNGFGDPVIKKWDMSTKFEEFLQTKTLKLVDENVAITDCLERSIIRLLRKGQQLKMKYSLPEEDVLDTLHGSVILPSYKSILDHLEVKHKDVIYDRFDLVPIHHGKMYMYIQKGLEHPTPPSVNLLKKLKYYPYPYPHFRRRKNATSMWL